MADIISIFISEWGKKALSNLSSKVLSQSDYAYLTSRVLLGFGFSLTQINREIMNRMV